MEVMRKVFILVFFFSYQGFAQTVEVIQNNEALRPKPLTILNSNFRETNLSISPDGKYLFFMSLRGGNPWSVEGYSIFRGKPRYDGDIWYSTKEGAHWSAPGSLPQPVNSSNAEDEPNINPDGQSVMYQSWRDSWLTDGGPYYISNLQGTKWGKPVGMSGGINQYFKINFRKHDGYATDGAALSPDGNIFLVALAPDYNDSMDIYISRKEKGIWSYLKKTDLSTPGDERSIFIAGDNKTVYFGSNGYSGFGGMDIFKTTLNDDDSFGDIYNIGEPFNSKNDDLGFIVTASGEESYFIRDDDIYYCDLRLASDDIKPLPSVVIKGVVTDIFGYPLESEVAVLDKNSRKIKGESVSNSQTGEYAVSVLKEVGTLEKVVVAPGHKPHREDILISDIDNYEEKTVNTILVEENSVLVHFDFDNTELKAEDKMELDSLAGLLYKNRKLRLILEGHTDEKGTKEYNKALSMDRIISVTEYLRNKGIPSGIMRQIAFGETHPRAGIDIVNRDALNRRVEIKVVEIR